MHALIKKQMVIALFLFLVQLITIAFVLVSYQLQWFSFLYEIIIVCLTAFIAMDLIYVWVTLAKIASAKHKNEVKSVEVIGGDIQEAYNFGKIGLMVTDDQNNIIWVNEWFGDIRDKILDINIFEWKKELIELLEDNEKVIKIDLDNHIYEVKNLKEANLYIFKDVTEYEAVVQFSNDHSPAVGFLMIDNYSDISQLMDDEKYSDLINSIQKLIATYAKKHNLLFRKFRNDSYIILCTKNNYDKMLEDKFSLIDEVRAVSSEVENNITISIGFAVGFDDFVKLSEMANSALDVALSRGGDQVVINPYGENLLFIGGKSEAKSRQSRVKIKILSKSLSALISDATSVYIMGHIDLDMDALGGALGLYTFAKPLIDKVKIVYDERLIETKTRLAFKRIYTHDEIVKMTVSPKSALEKIDSKSLLILVDVHRPSMVLEPKLIDAAEKIAVIDHHRRAEEFVDNPVFVHIDPSSSSSAELVTEMIRFNEARINVEARCATIMLSGILLDTNYYRQRTGSRTYDASLILKEYGADNIQADDFLKEEYEEFALKMKIMSNSTTPYYGIVVALSDKEDIIDRTMLAVVASETIQIKGINACFVIGRTGEKETRISARSDGTVNVQKILEKLGGGGHFTSAAAKFDNLTIEEVNKQLLEIFQMYLQDARSDS